MAITAQELITRSYILSGAVSSGNNPTTDESNDALNALNEMLANWAESGVSVPYRQKQSIALTTGKTEYLLGDFEDTDDRPLQVHESWLEDAENNTYPFEIIDVQEFARISQKTATNRPTRAWIEPQYPSSLLTLDAVPDQSYTLQIISVITFSEFDALTTESVLPTSYTRALRFNLAVELGGELGAPIDPRTIAIAETSFRTLKNANLAKRVPELKMDDALIIPGRFDIHTNGNYR